MVIVDTGPLLAAADLDDNHHVACAKLLRERQRKLLVPACVVVEVSWLLERNLGPTAEAAFLKSIGEGDISVLDLNSNDYIRASELVVKYANLNLGMVDARATKFSHTFTIEPKFATDFCGHIWMLIYNNSRLGFIHSMICSEV
ncbi:MAG: PIN domain-containing protein [Acidimicrobiales bacterium]|nr:PIN domain-containing protein [Acidimicrobiales bacterium]